MLAVSSGTLYGEVTTALSGGSGAEKFDARYNREVRYSGYRFKGPPPCTSIIPLV